MRLAAVGVFIAWGASALAQDQQERAREIEKLRELESKQYRPEAVEATYLDYGGWLRPQWFSVDDGEGHQRSRQDYDARLWVDFRYKDVQQFYLRMQSLYYRYANGDGPEGFDEFYRIARVDVATYEVDLGKGFGGSERNWDASIRIGRQYVQMGTGLLLNGVMDGVTSRLRVGPVDTNWLAVRPLPWDRDLDRTIPDSSVSKRYFFGGTADLDLTRDVVPYFMALVERDENENDGVAFQKFDFNTEYWAAGLRGALFDTHLTFQVEGAYQTGSRFAAFSTDHAEDIKAWGAFSEVAYVFESPLWTRVGGGVIYGSGDKDRFSVPGTAFGNSPGTDDTTFVAFGYVPTGYVLSPMVANILIYRGGLAVRPIRPRTPFEIMEVEVGSDFYWYQKNEKSGGISDPSMNLTSKWVGWEVDGYINVVLFSDLSFVVRAGYFKPGDEPTLNEAREFFLASLVFSF